MAQPSEPYTQGSTTNSVRSKGRIGVVNPVKQIPSWMSAGTTAAHYATDADLAAARTLEQSRAMAANNANGGQYGLDTRLNGGGGYATPDIVQTQNNRARIGIASSSGGGGGAPPPSPMGVAGGGGIGTNPAGGYANKYRTNMEAQIAYQNPEILAADVLKSMGINDPSLAAMLAADGNFASLAAFLTAGNGDASTAKQTNDSAMVNFMANYFKNQASVGGAGPDTSGLVSAILNSGSDLKGQIAQYFGLGSTAANPNQLSNVTDTVNTTLGNAINDQNPYTQKATKNALAQAATDYIAAQAHGQKVPDYATYLKGQAVGNWFTG